MMNVFAKSPLGKYWFAIRASPKGLYNWRVLLTVAMFALSGMPKGWDEGTTASLTQLKSLQDAFDISPTKSPQQVSNIVSFVNLTAGIGGLLSFFINDRLGRLWTLRLYMAIYMAGVLIETFSSGIIGVLYLGRLVAGLGIGSLTVIGPMAIVEIAPKATRGLMTLWFNVCMIGSQMVGIFVVYGANVNISSSKTLQYQVPFFVQLFVPTIAICLSLFMYESPRWLYLRGRKEEAFATLVSLRGLGPDHEVLLSEWSQLSHLQDAELAEFGKPTDFGIIRETFTKRSNLRRVQLTLMAYLLAQLCGANSVTNYLPQIFGFVGVKSDNTKIYASGLYAFSKLIWSITASLVFVEAVGRRRSLLIGVTVQAICLSYLAGYLKYFLSDPSSVGHGASEGALAAIYIYSFGWSVGLYTLPYLFGSELWPGRLRSFGSALSSGFHWLFYFAFTKATPSLLSSMDTWGAFVFFTAWCIVSFFYGYFLIPETTGRPLEGMNALFEHSIWQMRRQGATYGQEAKQAQLERDEEDARQAGNVADEEKKSGTAWVEDAHESGGAKHLGE